MIISRTPFRISFFGGGTDYPTYYENHGGAVLSTSINKYCYVMCRYLPPFFNYRYRIRYTKREETQTIAEIKHPSVRECLTFFNLDRGIELQHNADLPAMSGLGSSSAFTVGLLKALYALQGKMVTKARLALDAIHVEQERIRENVGSQDQAAAAFGGFNKIEFGGKRKITVRPVIIDEDTLRYLQEHLMLFFTGFPRSASEIAAEQIKRTPAMTKELNIMKQMVDEALNILNGNLRNHVDFGRLLHEAWQVKRSLTPKITSSFIDEIYEAAIRAGALGGKLLGAGGGGFMLFFVEPTMQTNVRKELEGLLYVPFRFHDLGSEVVYYAPEENIEESDLPDHRVGIDRRPYPVRGIRQKAHANDWREAESLGKDRR